MAENEGKQITDLNETSALNANDYFVVSQAGNTELTKVSASVVSNAVSGVLTDGVYSELVYATSQGKNAIALALTQKGQTASASDTLLELADKIDALEVDSTVQHWPATLQSYSGFSSSFGGIVARRALGNNFSFIAYTTKLYCHKITEVASSDYNDLATILASDASCDLHTPLQAYTCMAISGNGKYVTLITPDTTNGMIVDLYEYDSGLNTLTYKSSHNITGWTANRYAQNCGVSNDGTSFFFLAPSSLTSTSSTTGYLRGYDFATGTLVKDPDNFQYYSTSASGNIYPYVFADDSYIYIIDVQTSDTIRKRGYSKNETGTISFADESTQYSYALDNFYSTKSNYNKCYFFPEQKLFIGLCQDTVNSFNYRFRVANYGYYDSSIKILDLATESVISGEGIYIPITYAYDTSYSTNYALYGCAGNAFITVTETSDGVFEIKHPQLDDTFTYSRSSATITKEKSYPALLCPSDAYGTVNGSTSNPYSISGLPQWSAIPINLKETETEIYMTFITERSTPSYGYAYSFYYAQDSLVIKNIRMKKNQKAFFYRNKNGLETLLIPGNSVDPKDVRAGYYDASTTITPAVPDEGEEGEEETPGGGGSELTPYKFYTKYVGTDGYVYTKELPTADKRVEAYNNIECTELTFGSGYQVYIEFGGTSTHPEYEYHWQTTYSDGEATLITE